MIQQITPIEIIMCCLFILGVRNALSEGGLFGFIVTPIENLKYKLEKYVDKYDRYKAAFGSSDIHATKLFIVQLRVVYFYLLTWLTKPLYACVYCMASVWGSVFYFISKVQTVECVLICYICIVSGFIYILTSLLSLISSLDSMALRG